MSGRLCVECDYRPYLLGELFADSNQWVWVVGCGSGVVHKQVQKAFDDGPPIVPSVQDPRAASVEPLLGTVDNSVANIIAAVTTCPTSTALVSYRRPSCSICSTCSTNGTRRYLPRLKPRPRPRLRLILAACCVLWHVACAHISRRGQRQRRRRHRMLPLRPTRPTRKLECRSRPSRAAARAGCRTGRPARAGARQCGCPTCARSAARVGSGGGVGVERGC